MARAHSTSSGVHAVETPPEVSHDLDWAFGDVGEEPFFADDSPVEEAEEAAFSKVGLGVSDIARPAAAPDGPGGPAGRARRGRAREDGAAAAITFGRRELEIPDKKPPRRRPALPGLGHAGRRAVSEIHPGDDIIAPALRFDW